MRESLMVSRTEALAGCNGSNRGRRVPHPATMPLRIACNWHYLIYRPLSYAAKLSTEI